MEIREFGKYRTAIDGQGDMSKTNGRNYTDAEKPFMELIAGFSLRSKDFINVLKISNGAELI